MLDAVGRLSPYVAMELSEGHAKELAKQAARKTALKKECLQILGGVERIVFEAGCGHGHWLTAYAEAHPEQTCLGIDLIAHRVRKGQEKCAKRDLPNLHFLKAELGEFLEVLPPEIRFDLTVFLFPDPWPKARHHRRRRSIVGESDGVGERLGGLKAGDGDRPFTGVRGGDPDRGCGC